MEVKTFLYQCSISIAHDIRETTRHQIGHDYPTTIIFIKGRLKFSINVAQHMTRGVVNVQEGFLFMIPAT